jgi:hypothetical protein
VTCPHCGKDIRREPREPKVHYQLGPKWLDVACGFWLVFEDRALITRGRSLVTCLNCLRSKAFKAEQTKPAGRDI